MYFIIAAIQLNEGMVQLQAPRWLQKMGKPSISELISHLFSAMSFHYQFRMI